MIYPRVKKQRQVVCTNTQAVKPKTASSNIAPLLSFKNTQNNTGLSIEHNSKSNQGYVKSYVRVKSKDGKTYNFNATLEKRINNVTTKLQKAEKENGLIGKAWSWTKNTIGFGDSSNKVREIQANERKLLAQFNSNEKTRANVFKQLTGCEYNEENLEKFIKGQIKLKSEIAIQKYKEGQEMAVDITSDIVSGVVAYGTATACIAGGIAAAPFTAGASLGAVAVGVGVAAGAGAATKVAIKGGEAAVGGKKYSLKQAGKDATIGAVSGALAPVTIGAGGAVATSVGKVAPKFIATSARFAVEGGTFGAVDGGTRSSLEGDSIGDVALNTLKGAGIGIVAGNVLGHSGNTLGTISKKVGSITHTKTSNPLNVTKSTAVSEVSQLVSIESLNLKNVFVKIPKLDPLNINENALCLVHMSDFGPSAGKIMSVRDAMGASRNSVHFTLNHPVESHCLGSWEKCKFAYIMPYKATKEANAAGKIIEGLPHDLYTNGSVTIPEGSVIVKYNKNIESGKVLVSTDKKLSGVKIIETSDDVYGTVNNVIEKMGYTKATPDNVGGFSSRTPTKETITEDLTTECQAWMDFCKTQGIKPMQHGYSPNGTAEQIIETLDMMATTNKWKNGSFNNDYKKIILESIEAIKKRVNEDGYFVSMDLDKLAEIVSKSFTPRIALYRIKHQMNIKPILHRTRKIFSNYNDYKCTIDTRPISPDKHKCYYDFFLSDKADANSEFIQRHVECIVVQ